MKDWRDDIIEENKESIAYKINLWIIYTGFSIIGIAIVYLIISKMLGKI